MLILYICFARHACVSTKKRLQDWRPLLKEYERRTEQMNVIKLVENLRVDPRAVFGIGLKIISKSEVIITGLDTCVFRERFSLPSERCEE